MTPKTCGSCCHNKNKVCTNHKSCATTVDDTFGCIHWARAKKEVVVSIRLLQDEAELLERDGMSAGLKAREILRGWINAQGS